MVWGESLTSEPSHLSWEECGWTSELPECREREREREGGRERERERVCVCVCVESTPEIKIQFSSCPSHNIGTLLTQLPSSSRAGMLYITSVSLVYKHPPQTSSNTYISAAPIFFLYWNLLCNCIWSTALHGAGERQKISWIDSVENEK